MENQSGRRVVSEGVFDASLRVNHAQSFRRRDRDVKVGLFAPHLQDCAELGGSLVKDAFLRGDLEYESSENDGRGIRPPTTFVIARYCSRSLLSGCRYFACA
jgi:hypothetical protein